MKEAGFRCLPYYRIMGIALMLLLSSCSSDDALHYQPGTEEARVIAQLDSVHNSLQYWTPEESPEAAFEFIAAIREQYADNSAIVAYSYMAEGFLYNGNWVYPMVYKKLSKAYKLGMELGLRDVVVRSASLLMHAAFITSEPIDGPQMIAEVKTLANQPPHNPDLIHLAYYTEGVYYFETEDFVAALQPLMKAADYFEKVGDTELLLNVKNIIGRSLQQVGRSEEAKNFFAENLRHYYSSGNKAGISQALNNLAIALYETGQVQAATDSLKVALEININLGRDFSIITTQYNIGLYLRDLERYDESERYLRESLARSERISLSMGVLYNSFGLARTLIMRDSTQVNIEEVRALMQQSANSVPDISELDLYVDYSKTMFRLEQIAGNIDEALRWHIIYHDAYSEMKSVERQVAIEELMFANRIERSEDEILHLSEVISLKDRAQQNLYGGLAILALLLIGAGGAGYHFRRLSRQVNAMYITQKVQNSEIASQHEELKRLSDERMRLTKVIIHDLRNPIGAIKATLEMLEDYPDPDKELEQFKMFLRVSVQKMSSIVNGLLRVYKTESLDITDKLKAEHVTEMLHLQIREFSALASRKDQKLEYHTDDIRAVTHDQTLHTIVSNLLSNAVKYTPHGKTITLTAQNVPNGWKLTVRDEGPGFRESDKEKMFTLFGRLSGKPTGEEESTGIGLYAVKTAAEKLKAELAVNWDYKNGAELSCFFPLLIVTGQQG